MKSLTKLSILALLLMTIPACNSDGEFDIYEVGPSITEAGERVNESADNVDKSLDENPAVDQSFPEARRTTGLMRLGAEVLLVVGAILTYKRKQEAENLLSEVDANPTTPKAEEQATTARAKKTARKLAG